jgi:alanyl-tRNA synthetase
MVLKDDPTLMFTNAGMNQFKDIFLGNSVASYPRVANTQKCLRVSGKHNDLEEVGHDTYHHTMFEMLGNWSFGDYFKKEAIEWGYELLTQEYGIPSEDLYVTVFGGAEEDGLGIDQEAYDFWKAIVPEEKILHGSKKDNFWEMGDTGPCGPCSEIHIDIRPPAEKAKIPGKTLVNQDHPQVIEIWNLVFIEFNRLANGKLEKLPEKHIDTGMGFERLTMALQGKQSNYDTDIFQPLIHVLESVSGISYRESEEKAIAMRVIADHSRAVTFAIADGQLPSNIKAGYVIRRILRRAIRYGFTFLNLKKPFLYQLIPVLVEQMGDTFPEIKKQQSLISKVIKEEETTFLRTLEIGINRLNQVIEQQKQQGKHQINGDIAFELYDTYGFPFDLTQLIAKENQFIVNEKDFMAAMQKQKARSKKDAEKATDDWVIVRNPASEIKFIGYEHTEADMKLLRYRKIVVKKKTQYQLVFDQTPFYAESGGQVGDTGYLAEESGRKIIIFDTKKENNLIVHFATELPENPRAILHGVVASRKRTLTENNHSATHLLHQALRSVLGPHVEQKGSLVSPERLRFDFAHFQKMTVEELIAVEQMVNQNIRKNYQCDIQQDVPIEEAKAMGAMMLFGEKYGAKVRVVRFGDSVELCGGTHVRATGQIGIFKILSESGVAAGVRRIEAVTADEAEKFLRNELQQLEAIRNTFKNTRDVVKSVRQLHEQNKQLEKKLHEMKKEKALSVSNELKNDVVQIGTIQFLSRQVTMDADSIKNLAFSMNKMVDNLFFIIGSENNGKASLTLMIAENLVKEKGLHAGKLVKELAKEIKGGGGGQPHFASAGGKDPQGIARALKKAKEIVETIE